MTTIIKISILKKHITPYRNHIWSDVTRLNMINALKLNFKSNYNILEAQMFSILVLDFIDNLVKIKPILELNDTLFTDLTVEQQSILQNFSFFLVKFWTESLKLLITLVHIRDFRFDWAFLFEFWLRIPVLLNELQNFLYIPKYENLAVDVCQEFCDYLILNDSILYIYSLYRSILHDGKPLYSWKNLSYRSIFKSNIYYNWKNIDSNLLFYLLSLLKASNKNFIFDVKKLYADVDGDTTSKV